MSFKPGDLVMVVKPRPCCGNSRSIGHVSTVISVELRTQIAHCFSCGHSTPNDERYIPLDDGTYCQSYRLIKIDPLTEQDKTETLQEITA